MSAGAGSIGFGGKIELHEAITTTSTRSAAAPPWTARLRASAPACAVSGRDLLLALRLLLEAQPLALARGVTLPQVGEGAVHEAVRRREPLQQLHRLARAGVEQGARAFDDGGGPGPLLDAACDLALEVLRQRVIRVRGEDRLHDAAGAGEVLPHDQLAGRGDLPVQLLLGAALGLEPRDAGLGLLQHRREGGVAGRFGGPRPQQAGRFGEAPGGDVLLRLRQVALPLLAARLGLPLRLGLGLPLGLGAVLLGLLARLARLLEAGLLEPLALDARAFGFLGPRLVEPRLFQAGLLLPRLLDPRLLGTRLFGPNALRLLALEAGLFRLRALAREPRPLGPFLLLPLLLEAFGLEPRLLLGLAFELEARFFRRALRAREVRGGLRGAAGAIGARRLRRRGGTDGADGPDGADGGVDGAGVPETGVRCAPLGRLGCDAGSFGWRSVSAVWPWVSDSSSSRRCRIRASSRRSTPRSW